MITVQVVCLLWRTNSNALAHTQRDTPVPVKTCVSRTLYIAFFHEYQELSGDYSSCLKLVWSFHLFRDVQIKEYEQTPTLAVFFSIWSWPKENLSRQRWLKKKKLNKLRMRVLCPAVRPFKKSPCAPDRGSSILGERRVIWIFAPTNPAIFSLDTRKKAAQKSIIYHQTQNKALEDLWWIDEKKNEMAPRKARFQQKNWGSNLG